VTLLDGIQVACFDLFDTLIHVRSERFPETQLGDTPIRSTIPILHERVLAKEGVSLAELRDAMVAVWPGIRAELERADGSDDERYKEMQAIEKYRRALRQLDRFAPDRLDAIAEEIAVVHHECLVNASEPADRAGDVLEAVKSRGIETVLISNWDHAPAGAQMLRATGLSELLDHVVISEAVGLRKPHRRLFELALEHADTTPEQALHVGDLARPDAWGAGRLGFRTVWIDKNEDGWPSELEGAPTLTVNRLSELLDHI
jgi:HAD superfamily hydrolase (TIGR01549 family)